MNINKLIEELIAEYDQFIFNIDNTECSYGYVVSTGNQLLGKMEMIDKFLEDEPNRKHTFEKRKEQIIGIIKGKLNSVISELFEKC